MNNCKNLKHRKQNYKYYLYCIALNKLIQYEECRNCEFKEYRKQKKIKQRTNKLAKLERKRESLFTDNLKKCYLCGSEYNISKHEIYCGRNRHNSMLYGMILPLCDKCHTKYQNSAIFNEKWHKKGQLLFNKNYPNLNFIDIFHINYL